MTTILIPATEALWHAFTSPDEPSTSHVFQFADVDAGSIPDGSTIDEVTAHAAWAALDALDVFLTPRVGGEAQGGAHVSGASGEVEAAYPPEAVTLADLRAASTRLSVLVLADQAGINEAEFTDVHLEVAYTEAPVEEPPSGESPFDQGALKPDATPQQVAEYIAAQPAFAENPAGAVSEASTKAATAYRDGDRTRAAFWTEVGLRLVALAANEYVQVGASLGELADTLRVSLP